MSAAEPQKKIYVIDTSVFMHDPDIVEHLGDNIIVVPLWVVEELDKLKKHEDWRGSTARLASRRLDEYNGSLKEGVATRSGGTIYISYDINGQDALPGGLELTNDKRVVLVAKKWQAQNPKNKLVLISKDTNLRLIANACGISAEDYKSGVKGAHLNDLYIGTETIMLRDSQLDVFEHLRRDHGSISESEVLFSQEDVLDSLLPNQCCTLVDGQGNRVRAIYKKEKRQFSALLKAQRKPVMPKNPEQEFAYTLLMDPNILLVTLVGRAGTGKTLMALLAGYLGVDEVYKQLVVYRPNIELGRSLGYLPGSLAEKFQPWMEPILDNLDLILSDPKGGAETKRNTRKDKKDDHADTDPVSDLIGDLMDRRLLAIKPISFLRGRSIHRRFVIIDEAQNLTPHQAKTIITRIGNGTKIVLTGDLEQIDDNFLSSTSNGLFHVVQRFKGQEIYGHITMQKTERSKLAELAAELL